MPAVITLTTDFGTDDPFVGIMKGVILSLYPQVTIIDLTHGIEPQNVAQAAWVLKAAYSNFPKNTVHVTVVDPGVGGTRRALAVQSGNYFFVGPDNGVLTAVWDSNSRCVELTREKYFLKNVSATFHGRDIFAPVAARLAKGAPLKSFGRTVQDPQMLALPAPVWDGKTMTGEIIYIDRFGNAITNISRDEIAQHSREIQQINVKIGRTTVRGLADHYSECPPNKTGSIISSWNTLEIFEREGHAARSLKLKVGQKVRVTP